MAGRRHLTTTSLGSRRFGGTATSMRDYWSSTVTQGPNTHVARRPLREEVVHMEREPGKELERARKIQQEPELERKRAPGVPDDAPGDTAEDAAGDIDLEHMALFGCGPAYVTNRNDGSVSVVDLRLIREIARIQVGEAPTTPAVGPDKRFVYVSNSDDNTLSVISTLTNTVVETVDLNAGGFAADFPWGVAVSPDSRFVYVANRGSSNVSVVDARRLAVVARCLSGRRFRHRCHARRGLRHVCLSGVGSMAVVDLSTNLQVKTINVRRPAGHRHR